MNEAGARLRVDAVEPDEGRHRRVTERGRLGSHEASPTAAGSGYHTARGIADRRSDVERCHESSPFWKSHYRAGPRVSHFAGMVGHFGTSVLRQFGFKPDPTNRATYSGL
jgi:hypothetical protein